MMNEGIILNAIDYQENHKIIYVLTKDGKTSFLVPRAKRIKGSLINETQSFNLIKYETTNSTNLAKIKQIEVVDYFFDIKNDVNRSMIASYACEMIYKYVSSLDNSEMLYNLFKAFLCHLSTTTNIKSLLLEFRIKMLYFLGINPVFTNCVICGTNKNLIGLSIRSGGYQCEAHKTEDNIGPYSSKIIYLLYHDKSLDITIDDEETLMYLSEVVNNYYQKHFDEELKGDKALKNLKLF